MSAAALWDLRKRRIPNALNAAVGVAGLWAQATGRGWLAVLSGLGAGVAAIALLWWPWLRGRIGGGDVKLAGAAGIWVGLSLFVPYLLAAALAGGVVGAIAFLMSGRSARQEIKSNLVVAAAGLSLPDAPIRGGAGRVSVPYGVAVALGALGVLWMEGNW